MTSPSRTAQYQRLLIASVFAVAVLTLLGGIVRITGSGNGCPDWPLCYGQLLPPPQPEAWINFSHRLGSLGVSLLLMATTIAAWLRRYSNRWTSVPPLFLPLLLLLQILLGGVMTALNMPALAVVMHLGLALLMLAALLVPATALTVADERREQRLGGQTARQSRRYTAAAIGAAAATWLMALSGGGVAASDAGLACNGFPDCNGQLLPLWGGADIAINSLHRGATAVVGLLIAWLFWRTWKTRRDDQLLTRTISTALALTLSMASIGALNALLELPPALRILHQGLALALWSAMVVFGTLSLRRPIPAAECSTINAAATKTAIAAKQPSLIADYISLTKPKVISLLLVTTLAAMFITDQGLPSLGLIAWTMIGGYLAAGGAGAINCTFDSDIDINMGRTSRRPVPSGRISRRNAFLFGLALSAIAFVVLAAFTTLLAAILAMIGVVYYALLYTRWLKRSTWQNIVIGGGAGAIPPLVGWTAVTGSLSLPAILLFVIVFYWTPPHFWALALVKQKDYARAGVPMLPVVAGDEETRWQILLYSLLLVFLSLLLTPLRAMGPIYLLLALALGGLFMRYAWNVWRDGSQTHIWGLYKYSLLYLALLFVAMVIDRLVLA